MQFDMRALSAPDRYKILGSSVTPRPIAWVTSLSADGVLNAAPYSFFNVMGNDPPTLALGLMARDAGGDKDTGANITATGEFVVNLVREQDGERMNLTCMDAPPEVDELACAGVTTLPSVSVAPPRIATSPVSFECRVLTMVRPSDRQLIVIGEVLTAHVRDEFILDPERLHLDSLAMGLIGRLHGAGYYARSTDVFQMQRPTYADWLAANS